MAPRTRTVPVALGPGAVAVLIGGVAAGWLVFGALEAARQPLGWAVACALVALLIAPLVDLLHQRMPRPLAVVLVFLAVGSTLGGLTFGVLRDLDDQVSRLKESAPEAAAELERTDSVLGRLAEDIGLEERTRTLIADLEEPSSGVAQEAASSAGAWIVSIVLTAFFLSWGPRLGAAGLQQIGNAERRDRTGRIARAALGRGRRYLLGSHLLAMVAGALAWGMCDLEGTPAPLALGVVIALGSVVPGVGVVVGALPAVLLELGLGTTSGALRLGIGFVLLQAAHAVVLRKVICRRSLIVGPAVILISLVLGFDVYGVGGAYYGAAIAVLGVAALDAVGREEEREAKIARAAAATAAATGIRPTS